MLDITNRLPLDQVSDRAPDEDEIVSLIVVRRPDPAGADPNVGPQLRAASKAFISAVADALGIDLVENPGAILLLSTSTDVEVDGGTIVTGGDLLALED